MSAAEAIDAPRPVSEVRSAGKFLFWAGVVLLCAWVLVPIYFLVINALSSPQQVTSFPKSWVPSFNLDSLKFFVTFGGVLKALLNSIIVAVLTMILSIGIGAEGDEELERVEVERRHPTLGERGDLLR